MLITYKPLSCNGWLEEIHHGADDDFVRVKCLAGECDCQVRTMWVVVEPKLVSNSDYTMEGIIHGLCEVKEFGHFGKDNATDVVDCAIWESWMWMNKRQ